MLNINQIIKNKLFPDCLKISEIIPIYKKGTSNDINNLRPINNITFFSKIVEIILFEQINNYVSTNNMLSSSQYAYRKNSSCELAINNFIYELFRNRNSDLFSAVVFLDLSSAFDTINRSLLIDKLKNIYRFSDDAVVLVESYFNNRFHCVKLNNTKSDLIQTDTGVVQGSTLGPLLFNMFIDQIL